MGNAVGQVLSFAVVISISPVPIIGVVLMLGTPRASANGPAFIAGWVAGLTVVATVVILLAGGGASDRGAPADWVSWLKLVLGLLLLALAVRQWRGRPRAGEEASLPSWMNAVDTFTPRRAASLGVALSAANPKNLILIVGAAAAIASTGAAAGSEAVAVAVFVLVATLGPGVPVALYFALGERSQHGLEELRAWMSRHNAAIMAVLCVVIGVKLIGDAISGLSV